MFLNWKLKAGARHATRSCFIFSFLAIVGGYAVNGSLAHEYSDPRYENAKKYMYSTGTSPDAARATLWVSAKGDTDPIVLRFPGHSNAYGIYACENEWTKEPDPNRFHFCLLTNYHRLVIPKNLNPDLKSWQYDSYVRFNLLAANQTFTIGDRIFNDVYVIETPTASSYKLKVRKERMISYYSKQFGMLGFQVLSLDGERNGPLWRLDGDIGIGAMPARDAQQ